MERGQELRIWATIHLQADFLGYGNDLLLLGVVRLAEHLKMLPTKPGVSVHLVDEAPFHRGGDDPQLAAFYGNDRYAPGVVVVKPATKIVRAKLDEHPTRGGVNVASACVVSDAHDVPVRQALAVRVPKMHFPADVCCPVRGTLGKTGA